MTAIEGLDRLEAPALWRPEAGGQRRDVYVAMGEAELVIQDKAGVALSHWSLPALVRLNPGEAPALFAPSAGSDEALEIEETEMIAALDRVTEAVEKGRRRPGRLRRIVTGLSAGAALGFLVMWLPGALRDLAINVMPLPAQTEVGTRMLAAIAARAGPVCDTPIGSEALQTLEDRLLPLSQARFVVVRDLPQAAMALPGEMVLLSGQVLARQDDPELVAGHVLAAALTAAPDGPMRALMSDLGLMDLVRLMASGHVTEPALVAHARARLASAPPVPEAASLRPGFTTARLGWEAYGAAMGLHVPPDAPPMPPAMDDTTWQALRGICE